MENQDLLRAKKWGSLQDQRRKLEFELSDISEQFERTRKENITKRYLLLVEALETGYAEERTIMYIAELGAEFGANKAYEYSGGLPFKL